MSQDLSKNKEGEKEEKKGCKLETEGKKMVEEEHDQCDSYLQRPELGLGFTKLQFYYTGI